MPRPLVALRVRIPLRPNGHADHPDFNQLPIVILSGKDWSHYVDDEGLGWCYDKTSGHRESSRDSPVGVQIGCLLVPAQFAAEAVARYGGPPYQATIVTEAEFQEFYDTKAMAHLPDEDIDLDIIHAIEAKQRLGQPLTTQQQNAIDPTHRERGIRVNRSKRWVDVKADRDVVIV